ncbi:YggT family protein, partial [Rhizobium ruizarguesonis]
SCLYAFNFINSSNQFVNSVGTFLYNVTEPVLKPIRSRLPNLGGIYMFIGVDLFGVGKIIFGVSTNTEVSIAALALMG